MGMALPTLSSPSFLQSVTVETPQGTTYEGKRFHRQRVRCTGPLIHWAPTGTVQWSTIGQLVVKCQSTVGQPSVNRWPTVGQLSVNCWPTVGQPLVIHFLANHWSTVSQLLTNRWPTIHQLFVNCWSAIVLSAISQLSVSCWPTVGQPQGCPLPCGVIVGPTRSCGSPQRAAGFRARGAEAQ